MAMSTEQTPFSPTPYGTHLGIEIVETGNGTALLKLPLAEHVRNRRGVAHGGAVASLLDSTLGAAVISSIAHEEWCGTLQLSIQYNDPARRGPLVAAGRVVRRGRCVAFAEGEVTDAQGRIVARAHGTWVIWPGHPDGKTASK
jgi:acyl-CoA thioesterase